MSKMDIHTFSLQDWAIEVQLYPIPDFTPFHQVPSDSRHREKFQHLYHLEVRQLCQILTEVDGDNATW